MAAQSSSDASHFDDSLYKWWFAQLPPVFRGKHFQDHTEASAPFGTSDTSSALGLAGQAARLAEQVLAPLYQGYHRLLMANPPDQVLGALQQLIQARVDDFKRSVAGIDLTTSLSPNAATSWPGWAAMPANGWADALRPMSMNLERAYGGLADAFGLAPSRQLQDAARDLAAAVLAHKKAQAEYLVLVSGALTKGAESMMTRLNGMAQGGESVDSMLALVRLWARSTEDALHDAMQSEPALAASAKLVRAAGTSRQQQQRIVAIASQALNIPTRQEVDEAYREIQELKRELRRLRKDGTGDTEPASTRRPARGDDARAAVKTPARRQTRSKGTAR